MRLEKYKIENMVPTSVGGIGIPFLLGTEAGIAKVNGLDMPQDGSILVADEVKGITLKSSSVFQLEELNKKSALGLTFLMPVGFKLEGEIIQLPWEPIMSISSKKTIVETPLAGNTRRGTVKEIINADDYEISIAGSCYDHTHSGYPAEQVEVLKKLDNYCGSIEIISGLTRLFEIEKVVITRLNLPAMQGKPYVQHYSMELISDEDFLLVQN